MNLPLTPRDAQTALLPAATLQQLGERANQGHDRAVASAHLAVEHALAAGQALLAAKKHCQPGMWCAWLADNFRGSKRTAQSYMRLAFHLPQIKYDAHGRAQASFDQLRCMMSGMSGSDGRVAGGANCEIAATRQGVSAPEGAKCGPQGLGAAGGRLAGVRVGG